MPLESGCFSKEGSWMLILKCTMENTEIYIKYLSNGPVPIESAYGRVSQRTLPLVTVAHLVAAVK